jgi:outer membrane protein OmpA-like peptidoglycan-associated protein
LKKTIFAVFFAMSCISLYAGIELAGTTASNFIKIPPFARAVGMGEAFTAVSDGTYGLYYNPAGLSSVLGFEAQITHISWFQNMNYEFISFVSPVPYSDIGKLGLAFAWFQVDEMNRTTELTTGELADLNNVNFDSKVTGTFSPHDFAVILGYSLDIRDNFSGGISIKYVGQNIDIYNGGNVTADIGFLYKANLDTHFLRAGLTLSNLGSELKMKDTAFEPPKILKLGVSDSFDLFSGKLLIAGQAILQVDYDSLFSAGAEYWIQNLVALRLGYKFGAFNHLTLGAGIKYNSFEFDYAFVGFSELGNTHRFSMLYSWGTPPVKLTVFPSVFSPNSDNFLDTAVFTPGLKSKDKLNSLKINIFDSTGLEVAELPVKITEKGAQWNGDSSGLGLTDGVYKASLSANYETGVSESEKISVEIDNTPPQSQVDAEPKLLKPGSSDSLLIPATFTFFARDRNKIAKWQFLLWDKNKKVYYNIGASGEPPLSVIWDGKSPDGDYVQTGEIYHYSLITYDTVGNKSQTKPQSQVVLLREIKLTFSSDAIFDPGQADVKITAYSILKDMKKVIAQHPESEIIVSGYTDNIQPRGIKYKDNVELSKARADAVKFFMVNLLSMNGSIIRTEGMGEMNPVATNDTLEGRLKNRRVEITIRSTIYK